MSLDFAGIEREVQRLDAIYRPIAQAPVDPDDLANLGAKVAADFARLDPAVAVESDAVLRAAITLYENRNETVRIGLRQMMFRCRSFLWAAHLPREWDTAEAFRDRLIHLSLRDQGYDTRDEILTLQDYCDRALGLGIDTGPLLDEVAAMSSDVDRFGMGSMRYVILSYGRRGVAG